MGLIGGKGSWNFKTLATASLAPRLETLVVSVILALLWTCLIISVSGFKENTWYLIAIGGIRMMQNVYAARKSRDLGTANFHFSKFSCMPTITGKRQGFKDDVDLLVDLDNALADVLHSSKWLENCRGHANPEDV